MKSMSPGQYEILFALFQLKARGVNSAFFKDICREVNKRRKHKKQKPLSIQLIHYHLSQLVKRPFVKRKNDERLTHYALKHGTWKLNQNPPLCIFINNETHFMLTCDKVGVCKKEKPSLDCVKDIVDIGKITLPYS